MTESPAQQLAAYIRQFARTEPPGTRLPSERELAERFGVSRPTVARVIASIRSEGLLDSAQGAGTFVRPQRPLIRMGPERLSRAARAQDRGGFRGDLAAAGVRERVDLTVRRIAAGPDVAGRLQVEPGTRVLERARVMYASETPVQLAQSYIPLDVAEGAGLVRKDTGPGGTYARIEEWLAEQRPGGQLHHFEERITVRAASVEERQALHLAPGVPVIRIVRVAYADDGRPVEMCDVQAAGDRYELVYRIPADGPQEPPPPLYIGRPRPTS